MSNTARIFFPQQYCDKYRTAEYVDIKGLEANLRTFFVDNSSHATKEVARKTSKRGRRKEKTTAKNDQSENVKRVLFLQKKLRKRPKCDIR